MNRHTSVVLLPQERSEELLSVVESWTASWLLDPALWVVVQNVRPDGGGALDRTPPHPPHITAYVIGRNGRREVDIFEQLGREKWDRVRLLTVRHVVENLAVDEAQDIAVDVIERSLSEAYPAGETALSKINLVFAAHQVDGASSKHLIEQGFSANVIVTPEDRPGPDRFDGFTRETNAERFDGFIVAHIATAAALWPDTPEGPYDGAEGSADAATSLQFQRVHMRGVLTDGVVLGVAQSALEACQTSESPISNAAVSVDVRDLEPFSAEDVPHVANLMVEESLRFSNQALAMKDIITDANKAKTWRSPVGAWRDWWIFVWDKIRHIHLIIADLFAGWFGGKSQELIYGDAGHALVAVHRATSGLDEQFLNEVSLIAERRRQLVQHYDDPVPLVRAEAHGELWSSLRGLIFAALDGSDAPEGVDTSRLAPPGGRHRIVANSGQIVPDWKEAWHPDESVIPEHSALREALEEPLQWLDVSRAERWRQELQGRLTQVAERERRMQDQEEESRQVASRMASELMDLTSRLSDLHMDREWLIQDIEILAEELEYPARDPDTGELTLLLPEDEPRLLEPEPVAALPRPETPATTVEATPDLVQSVHGDVPAPLTEPTANSNSDQADAESSASGGTSDDRLATSPGPDSGAVEDTWGALERDTDVADAPPVSASSNPPDVAAQTKDTDSGLGDEDLAVTTEMRSDFLYLPPPPPELADLARKLRTLDQAIADAQSVINRDRIEESRHQNRSAAKATSRRALAKEKASYTTLLESLNSWINERVSSFSWRLQQRLGVERANLERIDSDLRARLAALFDPFSQTPRAIQRRFARGLLSALVIIAVVTGLVLFLKQRYPALELLRTWWNIFAWPVWLILLVAFLILLLSWTGSLFAYHRRWSQLRRQLEFERERVSVQRQACIEIKQERERLKQLHAEVPSFLQLMGEVIHRPWSIGDRDELIRASAASPGNSSGHIPQRQFSFGRPDETRLPLLLDLAETPRGRGGAAETELVRRAIVRLMHRGWRFAAYERLLNCAESAMQFPAGSLKPEAVERDPRLRDAFLEVVQSEPIAAQAGVIFIREQVRSIQHHLAQDIHPEVRSIRTDPLEGLDISTDLLDFEDHSIQEWDTFLGAVLGHSTDFSSLALSHNGVVALAEGRIEIASTVVGPERLSGRVPAGVDFIARPGTKRNPGQELSAEEIETLPLNPVDLVVRIDVLKQEQGVEVFRVFEGHSTEPTEPEFVATPRSDADLVDLDDVR